MHGTANTVCPTCKGEKVIHPIVHARDEHGNPKTSSFTMPCTLCEGRGVVTPRELDMLKAMEEMWCRCEGKTDSYYVPDQDGVKHHWCCNRCHKVTQIG